MNETEQTMVVKRSAQFSDGYRLASKRAVRLLHERAAQMIDPRAKSILDGAALHVGQSLKRAALNQQATAKEGENGTQA